MTVNATQSSDRDQVPCSTGEVPDHLKNLYSEELLTVNATQSSDSDQIPCSTGEVPDPGSRELLPIIVNASPGQNVSIVQLEKNCWPWFAQSNIFIITCTGDISLSEVTMVLYAGS